VPRECLEQGLIFDKKFEIIGLAGTGGMSDVYQATHIKLGRTVALKLLKKQSLAQAGSARRIQQEAQLASLLKHPNVSQVMSFGVFEGRPYLAFEFLDGHSLDIELGKKKRLGWLEFQDLFLQICAGLKYAHEHKILHRDLKPGNIFLLPGQSGSESSVHVKIMDFGIAKVMDLQGEDVQRLTEEGQLLGTPLYMSPEQCRGEELTIQSDIYALGCIMFQAASGDLPCSGESPMEILYNRLYSDPPELTLVEDYPANAVKVIEKCMAPDCSARYKSVAEVELALRSLQPRGMETLPDIAGITDEPATARVARARTLAAIALLAACAVPLGLWCWLKADLEDSKNPKVVWARSNKTTRVVDLTRSMREATAARNLNAAVAASLLARFHAAMPDLQPGTNVADLNLNLAAMKLMNRCSVSDTKLFFKSHVQGFWRHWPDSVWQMTPRYEEEDPVRVVDEQVGFELKGERFDERLVTIARQSDRERRHRAANKLMNHVADRLLSKKTLSTKEQRCLDSILGFFQSHPGYQQRARQLLDTALKKTDINPKQKFAYLEASAVLADSTGDIKQAAALWRLCQQSPFAEAGERDRMYFESRAILDDARANPSEAKRILGDFLSRVINTQPPLLCMRYAINIGDSYLYLGFPTEAAAAYKLAESTANLNPKTLPERLILSSCRAMLAFRKYDLANTSKLATEIISACNANASGRFGLLTELRNQAFTLFQVSDLALASLPHGQPKVFHPAVDEQVKADLMLHCGDWISTANCFAKAAELYLKVGMPISASFADANAAGAYSAADDVKSALVSIDRAIRSASTPAYQIRYKITRAQLVGRESPASAALAYDNILHCEQFEKLVEPELKVAAFLDALEVYYSQSQWSKVKTCYRNAKLLLDADRTVDNAEFNANWSLYDYACKQEPDKGNPHEDDQPMDR
jgi:serine/threonine protein kinase